MSDDVNRLTPRDFARQLRKAMSIPEKQLWYALRNRRLTGLKFRRQYTIDRFVVDFACVEQKLIVEVDGESHADRGTYDQRREAALRTLGWSVVRASNEEVLQNLEGVLVLIVTAAGLYAETWLNGGYGQIPEGLEYTSRGRFRGRRTDVLVRPNTRDSSRTDEDVRPTRCLNFPRAEYNPRYLALTPALSPAVEPVCRAESPAGARGQELQVRRRLSQRRKTSAPSPPQSTRLSATTPLWGRGLG